MKKLISLVAFGALVAATTVFAEKTAQAPAQTGIPAGTQVTAGQVLAFDFPVAVTSMVEKTASLTIEVKDVDSAYSQTVKLTEENGGRILSSTISESATLSEAESARADLIIKIAPQGFSELIADLQGLGALAAREISGRDATAAYYDLKAELATQRALKNRLSGLLGRARNMNEAMLVEEELRSTDANIKRISERIKYLETTTSESSINLALRTETFASKRPWQKVGAFFLGTMTVLAVLVPLAGFVLLIMWIVILIFRKRKA